MGIGAQFGGFLMDTAVDWSLGLIGALALMTVIMAFLIVFSIGSNGMQKHLKEWFWGTVIALILTGSFRTILSTLASHLIFGGGGGGTGATPGPTPVAAAVISMLVGAGPF